LGYEIWDEEGEKKQGAGWKIWDCRFLIGDLGLCLEFKRARIRNKYMMQDMYV